VRLLHRPQDRRPQFATHEIECVARRPPAAHAQILVGAAEHMQQLVAFVDEQRRRHVPREQPVVGADEPRIGQAARRWRGGAGLRMGCYRRRTGERVAQIARKPHVAAFAKQLPVIVDRIEFIAQIARRFAGPKQQIAAGFQAEMKQR